MSSVQQLIIRLTVVLLTVGVVSTSAAQPDPRQMSGLPLPDAELPDGTISVRVIRGQLTKNVLNHPVELHEGDNISVANTDAEGRARFITLNPGAQVRAVTELDGQRIQSQQFSAPARGGIRVMLVGASDPTELLLPVPTGTVTFGADSWIQVELGEENIEVYYLFDVFNADNVPVEPSASIIFDMPPGAQSTTVLPGSSPRVMADGQRVELPGPFRPGNTPLRVAYILPYSGDNLSISQQFPVDLETLILSVEKWGNTKVSSPQISRRGEIEGEEGERSYVLGGGSRLRAGEVLAFELTGLPHHSGVPAMVAILLVVGILGIGTFAAFPAAETGVVVERRKSLKVRKEKLFSDLVKVEHQHRARKTGPTKYSTRRRELVAALDRVYRELEENPLSIVMDLAPSVAKGSPVSKIRTSASRATGSPGT